MAQSNAGRRLYLAAIPVGPAGLTVVVSFVIDPLVVLSEYPVMLLELVFDT